MFCANCGQKNDDSANFCLCCGTKLNKYVVAGIEQEKNVIDEVDNELQIISSKTYTDVIDTDSSNENADKTTFIEPIDQVFFYRPGENAYAECVKIVNDVYHFYCIDKLSHFYWGKNLVDRVNPKLKVGDGVWVNLKELTDSKRYVYKAYYTSNANLSLEFKNFRKYHKKGDTIYAPIVDVFEEFFVVHVGPTAKVRVYFKELPAHINPSKIKKNKIRRFTITELRERDNRTTIKLVLDEELFYQDKKNWAELPEHLEKKLVSIYQNNLEYIKENEEVCGAIFGSEDPTLSKLRSFLDEKYRVAYEKKQVNIQVSNKVMYMDFDLGIRNRNGVPQSACFKKRDGDTWALCLVGFASAECMFEKYVYIPNWPKLLNEVSEMALGDEDWDYKGSGKEEKYILKQYLLFDFYKSWLDNLIIEEDGEALFNTGLVDSSYDEIYCYLKKNTCIDDFYNRQWEFGYFACRAKGTNGKKLMAKFSRFPSAPSYVDVNRISDLYFNPDRELFCDYEHIIEDNLKRLPMEFLRSRLCYDSEMDDAISEYEKTRKNVDLQKIVSLVKKKDDRGDRFRRNLQNGLKDAVETARKYCRWNYKTAIPIYYPRNNSISLLLPLKLQTNPNSQVDVALVVERLQNGNYQGQTILTLEMAYQDARQICRPNSEWLTINNIVESVEDDDEEM